MTHSCETCRHFDIDPLAAAPVCDVSLTFASVERMRTHRTACGEDGRWWEAAEPDRPIPSVRGVQGLSRASQGMPFAEPAEHADGDFRRKVGDMPYDTENGLSDLGADASVFPHGLSPLALDGVRSTPVKVAVALMLSLVGWAALFACAVGCVWVGWMIAEWAGV